MPPKLLSDDGRHIVIRPLAYVAGARHRALRARARSSRSFPASCAARRTTCSAGRSSEMLAEWERAVSRAAPSRSSPRCATSSPRTWRIPGRLRLQRTRCRTVMASLPKPIAESYWVIPGRLLAGEYPGGKNAQEAGAPPRPAARRRLRRLHRPDRARRAAALRALSTRTTCVHVRKPIPDHGVPRDSRRTWRRSWPSWMQRSRQAGACTCTAAPASAAPAPWWPAT